MNKEAEPGNQTSKVIDSSRKLAREMQPFIAKAINRGHSPTAANAVDLIVHLLEDSIPRDRFNRKEFILEVDRIVNETGTTAAWFRYNM